METYARVWQSDITIPTYPAGKPEKTPLFLEKRAYQGSTGKVYPLPVTEKIFDEKEDRTYHAVFLENEYLKICVLPELGGRIQRALDKTNGYDFVYYNQVVKPALVGLAGPWISGGIEFNWPQHHRPSTFSPVDYRIEQTDEKATVYVGETDRMYGTKGMAAISLYPGRAYIEIRGQLYNGTDLPQTFLWWANPAVAVNDHTYSVFPPDVNAVMDHGRRAVSTFPIATGEYYKCDYSAGVDISRYKNIPVPTSYMAAHSDFDFVGNYDESRGAGLLHVADHHVSPGKKQWTWGNGDFGRTWDRNLTDEDGPYIELMTGVFTDNQPDFSWLKPQEEKNFVQYFMPYKGVGRVCNATKAAAVSFLPVDYEEKTDKSVTTDAPWKCKVYTTAAYRDCTILIEENNRELHRFTADLSPERCFEAKVPAPTEPYACRVRVLCGAEMLVEYQVYRPENRPIPEPAKPLGKPEDLKSTEELYLAATHLEQYRHASYEPADYYREGLRRDSSDIRLNNGYGRLLYRRGCARESIPYFERAIERQSWRNANPYAGECWFNLGLALLADGQDDEAYDAFYKSTWSAETASAGWYHLACLSCKKGNYREALEQIDQSLIRNWHNSKGRTLKAAILRKSGAEAGSEGFLMETLQLDPLSMGARYEEMLRGESAGDSEAEAAFCTVMRDNSRNYLDLALDYAQAGFYEDALRIVKIGPEDSPLVFYYRGWLRQRLGQADEAAEAFRRAEAMKPDYCFPNRNEEITILREAIRTFGSDAAPMAHYYLGNLYYDKKQYEAARECWERTVQGAPGQNAALAYRNLAIYYYNKAHDGDRALADMRKACSLDPAYPRYWLEYDQLAVRMGLPEAERLELMESHPAITQARDDLYLRYITLLNGAGRYQEAYDALMNRRFHPWEGGEGKVAAQYRYALIHLAQEADSTEAIRLLSLAYDYPDNLGEGKLPNVPDNEIDYHMGLAYCRLGDEEQAVCYLRKATAGSSDPAPVLYYNDQPSDYIYYQGLAYRALGDEAAARKSFHKLLSYGKRHIFDKVEYDFFAVSLPEIEVFQEDIAQRNRDYCEYLQRLGKAGLVK